MTWSAKPELRPISFALPIVSRVKLEMGSAFNGSANLPPSDCKHDKMHTQGEWSHYTIMLVSFIRKLDK